MQTLPHQHVGGLVEARLLLPLAYEGLDDPDAGYILLQHGVQRGQQLLRLLEERLRDAPENHEQHHRNRQYGQNRQCQTPVRRQQDY